MARAPALRNRPVRELDPQTRARWDANRYSRLYVAMLVRRCEAREYARELLVDLFKDAVHRIEAQARRRRDTIAQLKDCVRMLRSCRADSPSRFQSGLTRTEGCRQRPCPAELRLRERLDAENGSLRCGRR